VLEKNRRGKKKHTGITVDFFLKQYRKRLVKLYGRNYLGVEKW
jgi:hypothetical protein